MDVKKIISEMSLFEKIGQMSQNLYGWECYEINNGIITLTEKFKNEVEKYDGIGFIYGIMRSDPWSGRNFDNGITKKMSNKIVRLINNYIKVHTSKGIPVLFVEESPHGHQALESSLLPVNMSLGNSWNPSLVYDYYKHVGQEMSSRGVDIALVSVLDVLRDARWGRSEECFSEDPFLTSKMSKAVIEGIQKTKSIGVVAKHFIGQGSNIGGRNSEGVLIGDRELNEIHLFAAKEIILNNVKPVGIMVAYNHIDGVYCHANPKLLKTLLRDTWKYKGITMSDGTAIDNMVKQVGSEEKAIALAITSGVDVDLWNTSFNKLRKAVEKGMVMEEKINDAVERILLLKKNLGIWKKKKIQDIPPNLSRYDLEEESMVLLSNDGILPISNPKSLAIIGPHTQSIYSLLGDYTPFQTSYDESNSFVLQMKKLFETTSVSSAVGSCFNSSHNSLLDAIEIAKLSEYVLLTVGSTSARNFHTEFETNGAASMNRNNALEMDSGENMDKVSLEISEHQLKLINAIHEVNKNIIIVVASGRPLSVEKIKNKVRSIIWTGFPGPRFANALYNLLIGTTNFSGKLAYTLPQTTGYDSTWYNWRDHKKYIDSKEPEFRFGHGLSYSNFVYSQPSIKNGFLKFDVTNDSDVGGKEVIQIYITKLEGNVVPRNLQLTYFRKVYIKSKSTFKMSLPLSKCIHEEYKSDFNYVQSTGRIRISIGGNISHLSSVEIIL